MSEFTVCRTLDTHPALRYCLLLDDVRIAGGKPDYRGDNILISWRTKETYGPVDAIKTENSQFVTEKAALERRIDELCAEVERLRREVEKVSQAIEGPLLLLLAGAYVLVKTWLDGEDGARVAGIVMVVIGLINAIARMHS